MKQELHHVQNMASERQEAAQSAVGGAEPALSRRSLLRAPFFFGVAAAIPALAAVPAAPAHAATPAYLRGAGMVRRIKMYSGRTGEAIDLIYWAEGAYIKEALAEVDRFMRDWRDGLKVKMDPRNIDIIAATHRLLDTDETIQLISGYRSPRTNAMLRQRSRGVAKDSYHVKGMAADLHLRSRSVAQISRAALSCKAGGVGIYTRSNFVHVDCGPVRSWGR